MVHSMENNWATGCRLDQNEYLAWKLLDYIQFPNLHAYVAMYFWPIRTMVTDESEI